MNQQISIFEDARFGQIRTATTEGGEPLFCLADVCEAVGLTTNGISRRLSGDVISNHPISDNFGRTQRALFVNEDGLYDVILDSRKEDFSVIFLAISEIVTTFANAYYIHRHSILRHINDFRRIARHIKKFSPARSSWAKAVTAYSRKDVCGTQTLTGDFYFC